MDKDKLELAELKVDITKGFSVLLFREFILKIFSFFGQLVFARILLPEDFGYFVIITFIVTFVGLFSDIGLSTAIIQKKDTISENQISSIFTLKICLAITLVIFIYIFSPYTNLIFTSFAKEHVLMLRVLSLVLLFSNIKSIYVSLLERNLQYNRISSIEISGVASYYFSAIPLALSGFGVWSFIVGSLVKETIELTLLIFGRKWIPRFHFNLKEIQQMIRFGIFIQGGGMLNYLNTAVIPIIGGIKGGPKSVGLLDWSFTIVSIPESITNNFGRVAFAGFSKIQDDIRLLSIAIGRSIGILSIVTLFFAVVIFGFSHDLIKILYKDVWLESINFIYWFAGSIFFYAVMSSYGQGILVLGKSRLIFYATLLSNLLNWVLAFILTVAYGPIGIAVSSFISSALLFVLYIFLGKSVGIRVKLLKILFPKVIVALVVIVFAFFLNVLFPQNLFLVVKLPFSLVLYFSLVYLFAKNDMLFLLDALKRLVLQIYRKQ